MNTERMINELESVVEKYRNKMTFTGEINITAMCKDIIPKLRQLKDYEDLEEQGLLLKLPFKVGDTIYKPNPITLHEVVRIRIESIFISDYEVNISGRTTEMHYSFCCHPCDIGKTVFLTQAEAEEKLKKLESEGKQ